jgi:hypothetical protein
LSSLDHESTVAFFSSVVAGGISGQRAVFEEAPARRGGRQVLGRGVLRIPRKVRAVWVFLALEAAELALGFDASGVDVLSPEVAAEPPFRLEVLAILPWLILAVGGRPGSVTGAQQQQDGQQQHRRRRRRPLPHTACASAELRSCASLRAQGTGGDGAFAMSVARDRRMTDRARRAASRARRAYRRAEETHIVRPPSSSGPNLVTPSGPGRSWRRKTVWTARTASFATREDGASRGVEIDGRAGGTPPC